MIPYGKHFLEEDDVEAVVEVLRNGWLTQGPKIDEFEAAFAKAVDAEYAVAVSSATAGLHIACIASGMGRGDRALVPPITFVSTPNAVLYCGGIPVFVDIEEDSLNISPKSVGLALHSTEKVRVILPVHFGGLSCDMQQLSKLVSGKEISIIEDAAHALGARYSCGSKVGSCKYSDFTVFSLHPVKGVTAGEGGVVTTNDPRAYRKLLQLRSHGICKGNFAHPGISDAHSDFLFNPANAFDLEGRLNPWYYEMQQLGFNYRITDFQAALALSQLNKLDRFVARRRELAVKYDARLARLPHIKPAQPCRRADNAHHVYLTRIDFESLGIDRGEFMRRLMQRGVGSQVHYMPVHGQPYYQSLGYNAAECPEANQYYKEALTLPLFYGLSDGDFEFILSALEEVLAEA